MRVLLTTLLLAGADAALGVDVWVTTGDKTQLLKQQVDVVFQPGSGAGGTAIGVSPGTTFQTIEGFGAAMTDSSAWLLDTRMSAPQRDKLMRQLFSPDRGIGLNYLRVPLGASDFTSSTFYSYNDSPPGGSDDLQQHFSIARDMQHVVPRLQQALALNPELKLMASPWTAPAWMKTNNSLSGGSLAPQWEASYARYLLKSVQAFEAQGLPIDALTLQNEPLHTSNYPTMSMPASQQARLFRDHVGPLFQAEQIDAKLIAYDHNWDNTAYPLEVLGDPGANAFVDGVAFHAYAGTVSAQTTVHNAFPDKGVYFTEITGGDWATNFGDNLVWNLQNIIIGNTRNWGKTAIFWNVALDQNGDPHRNGCDGCRGIVTVNNTTGDTTFNEEFYALGHVTRAVRPGATRVNSTSTGTLNTVAFVNPDGSRAVIALNPTAAAVTARFVEAGNHFSYTIPAKSTATFLWGVDGADFDNADFDNGAFDDGGFQSGGGSLDAWRVFGSTTGNVSAAAEAVLSGDKSLKLFGQFSGGPNTSGISQGISVEGEELVTASLSALVRAADSIAATANRAEAKIEFYSVYGATYGTPQFLGETTTILADGATIEDTWLSRSLSGIAPAGAVEARLVLQFVQPSGQSGAVHIDNVAFTASLAGDYNRDGVVNAIDYVLWRDSLGSLVNLAADGDGNGVVDPGDFMVWKAAYGKTANATIAVPEQDSVIALGISVFLFKARNCSSEWVRR